MQTILVAVNDIFFYTKIRDALGVTGYALERARTPDDVTAKAAALNPSAVILNMNDERMEAFRALEQLKAADSTRGIPVLAFANHEEVDTWKRAKQLGVSTIVSRNEFSARLRELVEEVTHPQPSALGNQPSEKC